MSSSPTSTKILLTGATGYIGGTILSHLLSSNNTTVIASLPITALVRTSSAAEKLTATYGSRVRPVLFKDVDDTHAIASAAAQHDVVINTLVGTHAGSAAALVSGLAEGRKTRSGGSGAAYMIHTSGTSNLADRPFTGVAYPDRVFSDDMDVYDFEKQVEAKEPYGQRTAELGVVDRGLELGVETIVVMSPLIYGTGRGTGNTASIQIPIYIRAALTRGKASIVGNGAGVWDHVHVEDLARLYELVLVDIMESGGRKLPKGKQGIIFSADGEHRWLDIAQGVADAGIKLGRIESSKVEHLEFEQGTQALGKDLPNAEIIVELGLSSNSRTRSMFAREKLGWKPARSGEWSGTIEEEMRSIMAENKRV